jgi:cyclophilin family peptidyl-prolyl cis-trans isomerase
MLYSDYSLALHTRTHKTNRCNPTITCDICSFSTTTTDANSQRAGTGGPAPGSTFQGCDGKTYKRNSDGGIPDEVGKDHQRITNAPGTLSMANTGRPESGGSQFFINVNHNSFLDWFDRSSPSAHPVFGKVTEGYDLVEQISKVPTRNDNPTTPIKMISVRVS